MKRMNKKDICIVLLCTTLLFGILPTIAQPSWGNTSFDVFKPGADSDQFIVKTYSMASHDSATTKMVLFTKIPYDYFQFVFDSLRFRSKYEITVQILENENSITADKINKYQIEVNSFEKTNSRNDFAENTILFDLKPGKYECIVHLLDSETQKSLVKKKDLTVPDYSQEYTLSDIFFLKSKPDNLNIQNIKPLYPAVRSVADSGFSAFFYIVCRTQPVSVLLVYSIDNNQNDVVLRDSVSIQADHEMIPVLIPLQKRMEFGQYTLHLTIRTVPEFSVQAPFFVQWGVQSVEIPDIQLMLDPLKLIMDQGLWKQIQKMQPEEQKKAVQTFWRDRDPTPESEKNELEEEFFRRVVFTNRYFSRHAGARDGWNTDQGRIYITYGQPTEIERSPVASESQYEIWHYKNLGKKFVFMKKSKSGVFYLVSEE